MPIDEITARATEAFPLLYKNRRVMGAKATETSTVKSYCYRKQCDMRHGMSEGRKFAGLLICCGRRAIQNE